MIRASLTTNIAVSIYHVTRLAIIIFFILGIVPSIIIYKIPIKKADAISKKYLLLYFFLIIVSILIFQFSSKKAIVDNPGLKERIVPINFLFGIYKYIIE